MLCIFCIPINSSNPRLIHFQMGVLCQIWDTLTLISLLLPVTCYCLPSTSLLPPLLLPFFSHSKERTWNGLEAKEKRTWNGPGTEVQRTYIGFTTERHQKGNPSIFRVFSSFFKHTENPKFMSDVLLLRLSTAYPHPHFTHNALIIFILDIYSKQAKSRPVTSNR